MVSVAPHEHDRITDADPCNLAEKWKVAPDTMERVWLAARDFETETGGRRVSIISGWRSAAEQKRLSRQGRPSAPDALSTHRSCPATGVDISLGFMPTNFMKAIWGRMTLVYGLRWGGGGPVFESGIPVDWQHVDVGPRVQR